jgi:hypothetical protein
MNKTIELKEKDIAVCNGEGITLSGVYLLGTSALAPTITLIYFGSIQPHQIYQKKHLPKIYKKHKKHTPTASLIAYFIQE